MSRNWIQPDMGEPDMGEPDMDVTCRVLAAAWAKAGAASARESTRVGKRFMGASG